MQENRTEGPQMTDLYCPELEHDNCGIGAVVNLNGERSHKTVDDALTIVERLEHRAGKDGHGSDRRWRGDFIAAAP